MSTKKRKNKTTRAEKWNEMYIKEARGGSDDAWCCIEAVDRDAAARVGINGRADLLVFEDGSAIVIDPRLRDGLDGSLLPALGFVTLRGCGHLVPRLGAKGLYRLLKKERKVGELIEKLALDVAAAEGGEA